MNRGWTCLVEYPFTDGTGAKVRPVLVVSRDEFNKGEDVIVVPISSRPDKSDPYAIYIDEHTSVFSKTGLRYSSSVKWSKPFTIGKSLLIRRLGVLDEPTLRLVVASILTVFCDSEPS
jgi:mRNA-degrading endonuclease toxin of MazEF toxin-antitoxin module